MKRRQNIYSYLISDQYTSKKSKDVHTWYVGMLFRWWWLWVISRQWWPLMIWCGWTNEQKIQQKTSIKNANIALSHCPSWFPINNFVPSDSVRFSPKSLSSAETFPYHAGFPKDGSDSKDDDMMKKNMIVETYLFLESLQSIKSWSQIASRGFTTTHSPSSSASASKFVWNTCECLCPQSLMFWS